MTITAISKYIQYDEDRNSYRCTQLEYTHDTRSNMYILTTAEKPTIEELRQYQADAFTAGAVELFNRTEE